MINAKLFNTILASKPNGKPREYDLTENGLQVKFKGDIVGVICLTNLEKMLADAEVIAGKVDMTSNQLLSEAKRVVTKALNK